MDCEWDSVKEEKNISKHGVSFAQAKAVLSGRVYISGRVYRIQDQRFSYGEVRYKAIGLLEKVAVLVVIHTNRLGRIRIISARKANRKERETYFHFLQEQTDD